MTELRWPPSSGRVTMIEFEDVTLCSAVVVDESRHEAHVCTNAPELITIDLKTGQRVGDPIRLPAAPTWSGAWDVDAFAMLPELRRMYVAGGAISGILAVDLEARSVVGTVPLGRSNGVAADPESGLVIGVGWPQQNSGVAVIFDGATLEVRRTLDLAAHHDHGIAVDVAGRRAYVTGGQTSAIDVIDLARLEVVQVFRGARGNGAVAVDPVTGIVYVDDSISSAVQLFDGRDGARAIDVIEQGIGSGWAGIRSYCLDRDSDRLIGTTWFQRTGSSLVVIDLAHRSHQNSPLPLRLGGFGAAGIAFDRFVRRAIVVSPAGQAAIVEGVTPSAIDLAHHRLGGASGMLGAALDDEAMTPDERGRYRGFAQGSIHWSPQTGAHETHGAIRDRWAALDWEAGVLGFPASDEHVCDDGVGRMNDFERGSIHWTPRTGAHEVYGAIGERWTVTGRERFLGYPLAGEESTADGRGRRSRFERGSIWWSPATPAVEVYGAILEAYERLDLEEGRLGYPTAPEADLPGVPGGRVATFEHGIIRWSPTSQTDARLHDGTALNVLAPVDLRGAEKHGARADLPEALRPPKKPNRAGLVPPR